MIANALAAIGLIVGATTLLDLLLSDNQKKKLSDLVIRAWDKTESRIEDSFSNNLRKNFSSVAFYISPIFLIYILYNKKDLNFNDIIIMFSFCLVSGPLAYRYISPVIRRRIVSKNYGGAMFVVLIIDLLLFLSGFILFVALGYAAWAEVKFTGNYGVDLSIFIFFTLFLLLIISLLFSINFGLILISITITLMLYALEFALRKVAEYPKGPLLGISAICGAVAGLLKAFQ